MPKNWITSYQPQFLEDLIYWVETNTKTAKKILNLMKEVQRDPFSGTGQVERLKYLDENTWSRRINQVDRLVYRVTENQLDFLQARKHY